jgi:hypothetical protein
MADEGRMDNLIGESTTTGRGPQTGGGAAGGGQDVTGQTSGAGGESKRYADSTESDAMGTGATGVDPVHSASGDEVGAESDPGGPIGPSS